MQPHIEQRAEQIVREHNESLQQKFSEVMEVQQEALRKARAERVALRALLQSVLDNHEQGFGLDTEILADIRAFLKNVEDSTCQSPTHN